MMVKNKCYEIIEVHKKQEVEFLGTKEKFWIYCPEENIKKLFKIGRPNTGEDWAEVAAYEIAKLLELPAAKYEFAQYKDNLGTLSTSVVQGDEELVHGNELLAEIVNPSYPVDQYYKVKEYRLDYIADMMKDFDTRFPNNNILLNFIGYLVFDCLIANQDRHHENWALILKRQQYLLAPSYDHAAGFGCREPDAKMQERLTTKDKGFALATYCQRAKTPFYDETSQRLGTLEACKLLGGMYPNELCFWLEKVFRLNLEEISNIFVKIPDEFINDIQRKFAQEVVAENIRRLCQLNQEICNNDK